jgi:predicted enzyme related to lactoylglutathione lyase
MMRWTLWLACAVLVAGAAVVYRADIAAPELPPLTDPPRQEHHAGKVIWAELVTPDLVAAKRFYGGLFGWTFQDIRAGRVEYSVARLDGVPVAGLVQRPRPPGSQSQPAWLTFLSVTDVRAAARAIRDHGGRQLSSPHAYRQRGRQAVYADPQGAVFAIMNSRSGDPPDVLVAPGEWIWSALATRDPGTDAAFYQDVFGYEVFDASQADQSDSGHLVLASEQYARASINPLPDSAPTHPHWVDFVRVTDIAAAVSTATQLGGRVLAEPRQDRHGARVALIADPAGARVGLLECEQADCERAAWWKDAYALKHP